MLHEGVTFLSSRELETQMYSELKEGGLGAGGSEGIPGDGQQSGLRPCTELVKRAWPLGEPRKGWESEGSVSTTLQARESCGHRKMDRLQSPGRQQEKRNAGSGPSLGLDHLGPRNAARV